MKRAMRCFLTEMSSTLVEAGIFSVMLSLSGLEPRLPRLISSNPTVIFETIVVRYYGSRRFTHRVTSASRKIRSENVGPSWLQLPLNFPAYVIVSMTLWTKVADEITQFYYPVLPSRKKSNRYSSRYSIIYQRASRRLLDYVRIPAPRF